MAAVVVGTDSVVGKAVIVAEVTVGTHAVVLSLLRSARIGTRRSQVVCSWIGEAK